MKPLEIDPDRRGFGYMKPPSSRRREPEGSLQYGRCSLSFRVGPSRRCRPILQSEGILIRYNASSADIPPDSKGNLRSLATRPADPPAMASSQLYFAAGP